MYPLKTELEHGAQLGHGPAPGTKETVYERPTGYPVDPAYGCVRVRMPYLTIDTGNGTPALGVPTGALGTPTTGDTAFLGGGLVKPTRLSPIPVYQRAPNGGLVRVGREAVNDPINRTTRDAINAAHAVSYGGTGGLG